MAYLRRRPDAHLGTGDPGRYIGLSFDVTERKINDDRNRLFTREVRHRAKNLLAVVLAIARQTAGKKDPEIFAEEFGDRVAALSSTLDLLGRSDWRGVDLTSSSRRTSNHLPRQESR